MKLLLLTLALLALSGCASSSTSRIEPGQLAELRQGQTTYAEVVQRFGRPNFLSKNWDGTQTAAYARTEGRSDAAALGPALGAVVGGASANTDTVVLSFDVRGVLTGYKARAADAQPVTASAPSASNASSPSDAPAASATRAATATPAAATPAPRSTAAPAQREKAKTGDSDLPWWLPSGRPIEWSIKSPK